MLRTGCEVLWITPQMRPLSVMFPSSGLTE